MAKVLTRAGFDVLTSDNASDCRGLLKSHEVDILIIDVLTCETMEFELISWARRTCPHIRIVAMSDFEPSFHERRVSLNKGANLFMPKPVDDVEGLVRFLLTGEALATFTGVLDEIDIIEYIQFILQTGRQVIVEISATQGGLGKIFIDNGAILHAVCGSQEGEEALYSCLRFKGGEFSNLRWTPPDKVTINKPSPYLLVEAARRRDEASGDTSQGSQP
jgi:CheY-like chemotaxis protein